MTEAIIAVQDFLFFDRGIESFIVLNAKTNKRSRRVKEKTGARYLGMAKLDHHEGISDAVKWEVIRESWATHRGRNVNGNQGPT